MREQIIGFEVAFLAKGKGFNPFPNNGCYSKTGKHTLLDGYKGYVEYQGDIGKLYNSDVVMQEDKVPASTQSLLQKWLREKHGIHLSADWYWHESDGYIYAFDLSYVPEEFKTAKRRAGHIVRLNSYSAYGAVYNGGWDTYEEALEAGLMAALQLIK